MYKPVAFSSHSKDGRYALMLIYDNIAAHKLQERTGFINLFMWWTDYNCPGCSISSVVDKFILKIWDIFLVTITMATAKNENNEQEQENMEKNAKEEMSHSKPICVIVLGMAGSGKTTFVQVIYLAFTYNLKI